MAYAAAIAAVVGGIVSAVGAVNQAGQEAEAHEFNAQGAEAAAAQNDAIGKEAERRTRINAAKQLGQMRAAYGASGVTLEGTPLDVLQESASNAEMDSLNVRHQHALKSWALRRDAYSERVAAGNVRSAGTLRAVSSLLGAGASAGSKL